MEITQFDTELKVITRLGGQEGYEPSVAVDNGGRPWAIWTERSRAGEQICILDPIAGNIRVEVTKEPGINLQPAIVVDRDDAVWIAWVRRSHGNWELVFARYENRSISLEQIVSSSRDGVFRPRLATSGDGTIWIAYEKVSRNQTDINVRAWNGNNLSAESDFGKNGSSCFRPSLCVDVNDHVWLAYDSYTDGKYSVFLRNVSKGTESFPVARNAFQNLQAAITSDPAGGVWIAWASNRNDVRKDPWWLTKWIYLRKYDGGQLWDPVTPPAGADVYNEDFLQGWEFPEIQVDNSGRVWVFGQSSHGLFMQAYSGTEWTDRVELAKPHWGTWKPQIRVAGTNPLYIASIDLSGARLQELRVASENRVASVRTKADSSAVARVSGRLFDKRPAMELSNGERLNYYFGDLHAHSVFSDATGDVDEFYHRYRDAYGYDFAALTDHDFLDGMELSRSELEMIWNHGNRVTANDEFVALCGFEWTSPALADHAAEGDVVGEGHRHVLYPGESGPLVSYGEPNAKTGAGLLARLKGEKCLVIPHHTAWSGTDWNAHDPEIQRLVEVCSTHGRFEYPGNLPIGYRRDHVHPEKYVEDALRRGYRLGFVGGSDSHGLRWHATEMEGRAGHIPAGTRVGWKEDAYRTGMTVVLAKSLSRDSIFDALYNRRCYATSGEPIVIDFQINAAIMGSEIAIDGPPRIEASAVGTSALRSLEIIRNGHVFSAVDARPGEGISSLKAELVDSLIIPGETQYYYLRVIQEDGNMAWSSPIWVTCS